MNTLFLNTQLGYELINEPFAGNIFKNPLLLIPGFADRLRLQDAYETVAQEIRKYDEDHIIFFEPVTWDNMIKVGFTQPPGGDKYSDRSVLAYHYYNPPDFVMELFFNEIIKDIQRLHVGGFLTEFLFLVVHIVKMEKPQTFVINITQVGLVGFINLTEILIEMKDDVLIMMVQMIVFIIIMVQLYMKQFTVQLEHMQAQLLENQSYNTLTVLLVITSRNIVCVQNVDKLKLAIMLSTTILKVLMFRSQEMPHISQRTVKYLLLLTLNLKTTKLFL
ncbi:hypothetical protein ABPG72_006873 [Tetrahymena utriculariae]